VTGVIYCRRLATGGYTVGLDSLELFMVGAGACSSTLDVINNSKIHGKFNSSSAAYAYGMFLSFKVLALAASPREL
jgi:hypothetical protein